VIAKFVFDLKLTHNEQLGRQWGLAGSFFFLLLATLVVVVGVLRPSGESVIDEHDFVSWPEYALNPQPKV
jgi:hypothetical protein